MMCLMSQVMIYSGITVKKQMSSDRAFGMMLLSASAVGIALLWQKQRNSFKEETWRALA